MRSDPERVRTGSRKPRPQAATRIPEKKPASICGAAAAWRAAPAPWWPHRRVQAQARSRHPGGLPLGRNRDVSDGNRHLRGRFPAFRFRAASDRSRVFACLTAGLGSRLCRPGRGRRRVVRDLALRLPGCSAGLAGRRGQPRSAPGTGILDSGVLGSGVLGTRILHARGLGSRFARRSGARVGLGCSLRRSGTFCAVATSHV